MRILILTCIHLLFMSCQNQQEGSHMFHESRRYKVGLKNLQEIDKEAGKKVIESLKNVTPDLAQYIIEYAFGDIYNRKELNLKYKEIAVVVALTAMGNASAQLYFHIQAGLNIGITKKEIEEILILMSVYSGFPSAIKSTMVLKEVINEE